MEFIKKYQLIIVLSLIVAVMAGIKLFYKPSENPTNTINSPTPTITAIPTPNVVYVTPTPMSDEEVKQYEKLADEKLPLWRLLPYQGKGFVIERYTTVGVLSGQLNGVTQAEAEKEAAIWMKSHKVDPKTVQIEWQ